MRRIVFYSWQSDLPNACNRGFIQTALEEVASNITADEGVGIEPVIDRDTKGVPGSPDIASTIFAKITAADVFVADISTVVRPTTGRTCPNPNVLIELGYALKALGHERIILIYNEAFGKIEELPFDLKTRRLMTYSTPEVSADRSAEKKQLKAKLDDAIRAAIASIPEAEEETSIPAANAIENQQPNRTIVLRRNLGSLFQSLEENSPASGATSEEIIAAIGTTQEKVAEFSKITETAVMMKDQECLLEITRWFGKLFERYDLPEGYSGSIIATDHDYFKFLGHEMFVTLVGLLIREAQFDLLTAVLSEPIPVRYLARQHGAGDVTFSYACKNILHQASIDLRRASLQADIIKSRHENGGGLSTIMPMVEFISADYFLFLVGEPSGTWDWNWRPWSIAYVNRTPNFIGKAKQFSYASKLSQVLRAGDIEGLKARLTHTSSEIHRLFHNAIVHDPLSPEDITNIATIGGAQIVHRA